MAAPSASSALRDLAGLMMKVKTQASEIRAETDYVETMDDIDRLVAAAVRLENSQRILKMVERHLQRDAFFDAKDALNPLVRIYETLASSSDLSPMPQARSDAKDIAQRARSLSQKLNDLAASAET